MRKTRHFQLTLKRHAPNGPARGLKLYVSFFLVGWDAKRPTDRGDP